MQLLRYVCLVLTISACDHKNQRDDQAAGDLPSQPSPDPSPAARAKANAAGSAAAGSAAVGSAAAGSAAGSAVVAIGSAAALPTGDMTVRPPVAADLDLYTKDMKAGGKLTATIETSMGTFHCELFGDKAPIAVANFVGLATGKKAFNGPNGATKKPFFDGLTFHRVIPGFMVQGGDPDGNGRGGPGYQFQNEKAEGVKMDAGMMAMANAGRDTNGSQFFITEVDRHELDPNYTIFGKCAETDLVKKITGTPRDSSDKPNAPVVIKQVTIGKS